MNVNEINARLEKALMDAADAADEAIDTYVDFADDPERQREILAAGFHKALKGLLPLSGDALLGRAVNDLIGESDDLCDAPIVPPANLPGGHDGVGPAREDGVPPAPRSPFKALADDHGLQLHRFSGSDRVLVCGIRERNDGRKTLWSIEVDKDSCAASVQEDGDEVFRVLSGSTRRSEMIAVRGLLAVLKERLRQARRHK